MKTKILMILMMGFLISCGNENKKNEPEVKTVDSTPEIHKPTTSDAKFKNPRMAKIYDQYIVVKTNLVNSDPKNTQMNAKELAGMLEGMESERELRQAAVKIADIDDLEAQREVFKYLTEGMINLVKDKYTGDEIYVQYCPMAFNGDGAYWLSNEKEIRNPYFGDKMMNCGEVKKVL